MACYPWCILSECKWQAYPECRTGDFLHRTREMNFSINWLVQLNGISAMGKPRRNLSLVPGICFKLALGSTSLSARLSRFDVCQSTYADHLADDPAQEAKSTHWVEMEAFEHLISPVRILCRREVIYIRFWGRRS
jgi:hypothetical protein